MKQERRRTTEMCEDCGGEDFNEDCIVKFEHIKRAHGFVLCLPCRSKLSDLFKVKV